MSVSASWNGSLFTQSQAAFLQQGTQAGVRSHVYFLGLFFTLCTVDQHSFLSFGLCQCLCLWLLYQTHLQTQLTCAQLLILEILISLLQSQKQVRLERLAKAFPCPIKLDIRQHKLRIFLDLLLCLQAGASMIASRYT